MTVMLVTLAFSALAKRTPCSTAFMDNSEPSVGMRMCLYMTLRSDPCIISFQNMPLVVRCQRKPPDCFTKPAGARDPSQCRANVADRASDAGLQDHRGLQEGQWPSDPGGLPPVHRSVPTAGSVRPCRRRHR